MRKHSRSSSVDRFATAVTLAFGIRLQAARSQFLSNIAKAERPGRAKFGQFLGYAKGSPGRTAHAGSHRGSASVYMQRRVGPDGGGMSRPRAPVGTNQFS